MKQQFLNDSGALAIGIQESAEVDELIGSDYASKSQVSQLLAGEEIFTANQRDGVLEDLVVLAITFPWIATS